MLLTPDQIKKIATLAKLKIANEEQATKYAKELSEILEYMHILQEVNTENTVPTAQVTGLQNNTHEDNPEEKQENFGAVIADETLHSSSQKINLQQIQVPSIL